MKHTFHGMSGKCAVYCLTNKINGKRYVGSSNNAGARVIQHFGKQCLSKYGDKLPLYIDIVKYGRDAFEISCLEYCTPETKIERERFWFHKLKPEYNIIEPCEEPFKDPIVQRHKDEACRSEKGRKHRLEAHRTSSCRKKLREQTRYKMRPCYCTDDYGFVAAFECMQDAARWLVAKGLCSKTAYAVNHIKRILDGHGTTSYGFQWHEGVV